MCFLGSHVFIWTRPFAEAIQLLDKAYSLAMARGAYTTAGTILLNQMQISLHTVWQSLGLAQHCSVPFSSAGTQTEAAAGVVCAVVRVCATDQQHACHHVPASH